MNIGSLIDWTYLTMPEVFEADYHAWLQTMDAQARRSWPRMQWTDLGNYAQSAYELHRHLAAQYKHERHNGHQRAELPMDCTPAGFYVCASRMQRERFGVPPEPITPYERLSPFSRFLFGQLASRVAKSAGFHNGPAQATPPLPPPPDDGLDEGLDDGLDDGLDADFDRDDGLEVGL